MLSQSTCSKLNCALYPKFIHQSPNPQIEFWRLCHYQRIETKWDHINRHSACKTDLNIIRDNEIRHKRRATFQRRYNPNWPFARQEQRPQYESNLPT